MGWIYLLLAGLFEIGFTTFLKMTDGFTKLMPSLGFFVCSFVSFWLLTKSMATIELGTAYAVWTGIGAFGTALIGILFFGDSMHFWKVFFLVVLIASILGLKLVSATE